MAHTENTLKDLKKKSYCIGIESIKWTRQAYGKVLQTFGYFI